MITFSKCSETVSVRLGFPTFALVGIQLPKLYFPDFILCALFIIDSIDAPRKQSIGLLGACSRAGTELLSATSLSCLRQNPGGRASARSQAPTGPGCSPATLGSDLMLLLRFSSLFLLSLGCHNLQEKERRMVNHRKDVLPSL